MKKLKTHKSLSKRVKISKTGKMLRRHSYRSHLLSHKSSKRKRQFVKDFGLAAGDVKKLKKILPYSK